MKLQDDPNAYAIMGCAMRVHSTLGYGFLESAYGDALEIEFDKAGIPDTFDLDKLPSSSVLDTPSTATKSQPETPFQTVRHE